MIQKKLTILVPNYKTPDITKICMRLLRRNTDFRRTHVIGIDNGSGDSSLDYLRSLSWIELIERQPEPDDTPALSHSRALDLALKRVTTPFVLSIHTDTFVRRPEWLDVLMEPFYDDQQLAGVGSWKLETKTPLQNLGCQIEHSWKSVLFHLSGKQKKPSVRYDQSLRYLRSHCAMYRTDVIRKLETGFSDEQAVAGYTMHHKMVAAGYRMKFLESAHLGQYVDHLNHATTVLNPELGSKPKSIRTGRKRMTSMLRGIDADAILGDNSLDD